MTTAGALGVTAFVAAFVGAYVLIWLIGQIPTPAQPDEPPAPSDLTVEEQFEEMFGDWLILLSGMWVVTGLRRRTSSAQFDNDNNQ